ncbi:cytidine deaminase [Psychromonas sp. KJ10-2]|uniref:cytidine deaminase n=1 Tax=Psychromonas sp. KJ10-2 TaxID=3391822 RepID=UPI0039B37DF4
MYNEKNYFSELETLLDNSSAPYSGFNVASVVVCKDGRVFKGVNVESAAYPTTICAERNAIFTAVAEGISKGDIQEVHIGARNADKQLVTAQPCGSCRQVIAEQSLNDCIVYSYQSETEYSENTIATLLPFAFLGEEL